MKTSFILSAALAIHAAIVAHEVDIESLDRAIGDGDHYINVVNCFGVSIRRTCVAVISVSFGM